LRPTFATRTPARAYAVATWITAYLKNGGTLEKAAAMANQPRLDAHDPAL
jgi:hypothetical protein